VVSKSNRLTELAGYRTCWGTGERGALSAYVAPSAGNSRQKEGQ